MAYGNSSTESSSGSLAHVGMRKRLRKAAQLKHDGQSMQWIGGKLFFTNGLVLASARHS